MTPYEELVAIVNGMGKEGKFVFIVDAIDKDRLL